MDYKNNSNKEMSGKRNSQAEEAKVQFLSKRLESLRLDRRNYEHVWDEITELVLPSKGSYSYRDVKSDPERKSRRRFDATPVNAARNLTARIVAEMTGTSTRWFDFRSMNPDLDAVEPIRRVLQALSDRAYSILNTGSFRLAHVEATMDWLCYGTACMFMNLQEGEMIFKAIPPQELHIAENKKGEIDVVFRTFKMSIRQVSQMWGPESLPDSCMKKLEEKPDEEIEIIHCVMPNEDYVKGSLFSANFKFSSIYFITKDKKILHQGGLKRMPYIVFRFWKRSGEVFGGSPAIDALADIRVLNLLEEVSLRAAQLEGSPPIITAHDSVIMPLKVIPNGINVGGFSPDGKRLIDRLLPQGANLQYLENSKEQKRMAIRSAFFVDPLINRENSIRTAAEVAKRSNEEMVGIAPFLNRYEVEYLTPVLDHLLEYILETDLSIVIPPQMKEVLPTVEYTAPLAKTQRAQELNNNLQFMQIYQTVAQVDPSVLKHIDMNAQLLNIADLLSIPMKIIVPAEIIARKEEQEQRMQQMVMLQQGIESAGNQMQGMAKAGLIGREDLGLPPLSE